MSTLSPAPQVPLTVGQLTALVRGALADKPELEDVLVQGEISNLRNPGSGHLYFTLKDASASLRCVIFRMQVARIRFQPVAGMTVVARGRVDVYDADGSYQLYVATLEPAGVGAIALAIEQLTRRLSAEGLFDVAVKRPVPVLPRRVAVVTSSTGAAVRDVCNVLRRRAPGIGVIVVPTPVQGDGAEASIVRALRRARELRDVDVVLLVRGGGSIEDLVAFQSEVVARAIREGTIPVITGIGHETDTTIADHVADRRAPTPSAAAEIAVPDVASLRAAVADLLGRLRVALRGDVAAKRQALDRDRARLELQSPVRRIPQLRQNVDQRVAALRHALEAEVTHKRARLLAAEGRLQLSSPARLLPAAREGLLRRRAALDGAVRSMVLARRARLGSAAGRLQALSPRRVIERGYSITLDGNGALVTSVTQAAPGDVLRTVIRDGELHSRVEG